MCVIFFYANSNPAPGGYKLILASNRDEFYARETKSVAKWATAEHVYGGIDLEPGREGGTWLAIAGNNGVFKVGALLNLTGEPKPRNAIVHHNISTHSHNHHNQYHHHHKQSKRIASPVTVIPNTPSLAPTTATVTITATPSLHNDHFLLGRGMIVSDYVTSRIDCGNIEHYNNALVADCTKYSAFNFVSIEIGARSTPARVALLSNVPPTLEFYEEGGCYGFGNSLPAVPFEKVRVGRQRFQSIVDDFNAKLQQDIADSTFEHMQEKLVKNLNDLLKCKQKFWPDAELKRRAPNWGEQLSALNVVMPDEGYGSRTHTVILVDGNDKMHIYEETMAGTDPDAEWQHTHIEKQYFHD